jgi:hypothetical protein
MTRVAPTRFGATVWKLLIIEPFSQWKLNKIESENPIGIWGCSFVVVGVRLSGVYFIIFRAQGVEDIDF